MHASKWWVGFETIPGAGLLSFQVCGEKVIELDGYLGEQKKCATKEGKIIFNDGKSGGIYRTGGYAGYGGVVLNDPDQQAEHTILLTPWSVFSLCAHHVVEEVTNLVKAQMVELLGKDLAATLQPLAGHWLDWHETTHFTPHRDTEEDRDWDFIGVDEKGKHQYGYRRVSWTTVTLLHASTSHPHSSMRVLGHDPVEYECVGDTKLFPCAAVHETVQGGPGDRKLAIFWGYSVVIHGS